MGCRSGVQTLWLTFILSTLWFPVGCSGVMEGLVEGSVLWKVNSNTVESLFVIYPGFCSFVCVTLWAHFVLRGASFIFSLTMEKMSHLSTRFTPMKPQRGPRFPSTRVRVCVLQLLPLRGPRSSPEQPRLTAQGSQMLLHLFSFLLWPRFHSPPLSWSPSVSRFVFTRHCGWCWATISGVSLGPLVKNFSFLGV